MNRRRGIWGLAALVVTALIGAGLAQAWKHLFLIPHVERFPDPVARAAMNGPAPADHHYEVVYDLVSLLPQASFHTPNLALAAGELEGRMDARGDPRTKHPLARLVTLGSSSNFRVSMRAIHLPTPGWVAYRFVVPPGARLKGYLGLLPEQPAPVRFRVLIDGEEVLKETETPMPVFPYDERGWFYQSFYSKVRVRLKDREARWTPFLIDLGPWEGRRVELRLSAESNKDAPLQAFFGSPALSARKPGPPRPMVLIIMDALKASAIGVYGSPNGLTPKIDAFAGEGGRVESFIAAANWSRPGTMTLLTGRPVPKLFFPTGPSRRKIHPAVRALFEESGIPTLPTLFRQAGYRTVAVVNNVFITPFSRVGVDLGFDQITQVMRPELSTMDVEAFVAQTLAEYRDENIFLYIHQNAPNPSDTPPRRFRKVAKPAWKNRREYGQWRYLACLAQADFSFGRFLAMFQGVGRQEATILLTADHGQVNSMAHEIKTPDGEKRLRRAQYFHGQTLYDEELKIPLILRGPGILPGRVLPGQFSALSLFPTVLSLAHLPIPENTSAKDLAPYFLGHVDFVPADEIAVSFGKDAVSIRVAGAHKYVRWDRARRMIREKGAWKIQAIREELFDLRKDPMETRNLATEEPDLLAAMRELYRRSVPPFAKVWALSVPAGAADEVLIRGAKSLTVASGGFARRREDGAWVIRPEGHLRLAAHPESRNTGFFVELFLNGERVKRNALRYGVGFTLPPSPEGYSFDDETDLGRVLKKSFRGLFHLENRKARFSVFSEFHGLTNSMKFAAPSMARQSAVFQQPVSEAFVRFPPPAEEVSPHPHLCLMTLPDWIAATPEVGIMDPSLKEMLRQWGYVQ